MGQLGTCMVAVNHQLSPKRYYNLEKEEIYWGYNEMGKGMNWIKTLWFSLMLVSLMVLSSCGKSTKENVKDISITNNTANKEYEITEAYKYSIVPGTAEWNSLDSAQKRKEVCKVPQDILSKMTTSALVETIVTYPYFIDVYAFDTLDMGVEALRSEFGGVDELLTRKDAYDSTLSFINNICPEYLNLSVEDDWDAFKSDFDKNNKTNFDLIHLNNAGTLLKIVKENSNEKALQ